MQGNYLLVGFLRPRAIVVLIGMLSSVALALVAPIGVLAQVADQPWSVPANVSTSSTHSVEPSIAIDQEGTVHIVWSERLEPGWSTLAYANVSDDVVTVPVEPWAVSQNSYPHYPKLAIGSSGRLHVIWIADSVYYSSAYAPTAGMVRSWLPPVLLIERTYGLSTCDLIVDSADRLHAAYSAATGGESGVYYLHSDDGGSSWSNPEPVYIGDPASKSVSNVSLAVDSDDTVHVVWSEYNYPETYPPLGVYYAAKRHDGAPFTAPVALASGQYDFPKLVVRQEEEVHVVWSGTFGDRYKFHRWSVDGGITWSQTWRNPALGGFQGYPALLVDTHHRLHWIQIGSVAGYLGGDAVYYQVWQDDEWTTGKIVLEPTAGTLVNAENIAATVGIADELYIAVQAPQMSSTDSWQFDVLYIHQHPENGVLSYGKLATATPAIDSTSGATPPTRTLLAASEVGASAVPSRPRNPQSEATDDITSPNAVLCGVVPAVLLVLAVILKRATMSK